MSRPDYSKPTDPYGKLEFAVGSHRTFWCFDYCHHEDGTITLHAAINDSEGFGESLEDAEPPVTVPAAEAPALAKDLVCKALEWLVEHGIQHDREGWSQDPWYFHRAVHASATGTGPAIRIPVKMVYRPQNTRNYL
jgi:hypothetical protein